MQNQILVNAHGESHVFEQVATPLILSSEQFLNEEKNTEAKIKKFQQKNKLFICIIPFGFSADLQLKYNEGLADEDKVIQSINLIPVRKLEGKSFLNIEIPALKVLSTQYFDDQINQAKFIRQIRAIKKRMRYGDYYLLNYTLPLLFNHQSEFIKVKIKDLGQLGKNGCYVDLPSKKKILSFSPECFIDVRRNIIRSYPIKGTLDAKLDQSLLHQSIKEKAETTMVVDLLRNDLGQICSLGSVKVNRWQQIVQQHNLWQMGSEIEGKLNQPWSLQALLKLLPAGSISGTPKHAAIKYIYENEISARNYYTGLCGYIDLENQLSHFNILIRTLVYDEQQLQVGVGAGITMDSNPQQEWFECENKFDSIKLALKLTID